MGIHVSLGVARDLSDLPHAIVLPFDTPTIIAGEDRQRLYVEPFGFDPSLAPPGKSALKIVLATSFAYWQDLLRAPERYRAEKQQVADKVIELLDRRFPGLKRHVEVIDVVTPMTTLHFYRQRARPPIADCSYDSRTLSRPAVEPNAAAPGQFLHGRSMGGRRRRAARRSHGARCRSFDRSPAWAELRGADVPLGNSSA